MSQQKEKTLHRLIYRIDGKVCFAELYAENERLKSVAVPTKGNYRFSGWSNLPERMPDCDVVIDGSFSPALRNLVFLLEEKEFERREVPFGTQIEAPEVPAREGMSFTGWEGLPEVMPDEDVTARGSYKDNNYRLTYVIDGKTSFTVKVPFGSTIEPMDFPVKDQHVFTGWEGLPEIMPDHDVTVHGALEIKTFRLVRIVDGEVFMDEQLKIGDKVNKKAKPEKQGYYFSGWRNLPDTMPDHDITAITSMYPARFRVDYEINGEIWRTNYLPYESKFEPEIPELEGMDFVGWTDAPETIPLGDFVVHGTAVPTPVEETPVPEEPILYRLAFVVEGEKIAESEIEAGAAVITPTVPEKVGFTFAWDSIPEAMPASDLEINGSFVPNFYKLSFVVEGKEIYSEMLPAGRTITYPNAESRIGQTFAWNIAPETMPAEDLTVEGIYTALLYKIVFTVDGREIGCDNLAFGTPVSAPSAEERIGYDFAWDSCPDTMPAEDLTVCGSYTAKVYPYSFTVDGETVAEGELAFGSALIVPEIEEKNGYTFAWSEMPAMMPAETLQATGTYTANVYRLVFSVDGETIADLPVAFGESVLAPSVAEREGYSFAWDSIPETMPSNDVTVCGTYTEIPVPIEAFAATPIPEEPSVYTVVFTVDGEQVASLELSEGEDIVVPKAPEKLGYTFSGWFDVPATVSNENLAFDGHFTINQYRLEIVAGGTVLFSQDVDFESAINLPEAPAKEGYVFDGWGKVPATMPAYNLTVASGYTAEDYRLKFVVGEQVIYDRSVSFGSPLLPPIFDIPEGYLFSGWGDLPTKMPANDLTFTAELKREVYNVVYILNGEKIFEAAVHAGDEVPAPETPDVPVGYRFSGFEIPVAMPEEDLTVTAELVPETYTLKVVLDGKTVSEEKLVYGEKIPVPEMPEKEGYLFTGWGEIADAMPASDYIITGGFEKRKYHLAYTVTEKGTTKTIAEYDLAAGDPIPVPDDIEVSEGYSAEGWSILPEVMPSESLTFDNKVVPKEYTVSCAVDGQIVSQTKVAFGEKIVLEIPTLPAKTAFVGWDSLPETMPAQDITVNALTEPTDTAIRFIADGIEIAVVEGKVGSTVLQIPEAPKKDGYSFVNWIGLTEQFPTDETTVFANYAPILHEAMFLADGEIYAQHNVMVGTAVPQPEAPKKDGYRFFGWMALPETMPDSDILVIADFEQIVYNVTFVLDGELLSTFTGTPGTPVIAPDTPIRPGYIFSGWNELPDTVGDSDVEVVGSFAPDIHSVRFVIDGETYSEATYLTGEPIVLPEEPNREGYDFSGWSDYSAEMPDYDLVVSGSLTPRTHKVTYLVNGEVYDTKELAFGSEIPSPEVPVSSTESFLGWASIPETMPDDDITLEAVIDHPVRKVTYLIDGEVWREETVGVGHVVPKLNPPVRETATFSGWNNYTREMPDYDFTVSGTYSPRRYFLTYLAEGSPIAVQDYLPGEQVYPVDGTLPDHSEFIEWIGLPIVMPSRDMTVTAKYATEYFEITYILESTPVTTKKVAAGAWITPPLVPEKDGYTFAGWRGLPERMPARDLIVIGKYDPAFHTITYRVDGEPYRSVVYPIGGKIKKLSGPTKEGYIFEDWKNFTDEMPDYDFTVDAYFRENIRTYTFVSEGNVVLTGKMRAGEPLLAPIPDAPKGYEFIEFGGYTGKMPEVDVVYVARFDKKKYRINYMLDGEFWGDRQVREGEVILDDPKYIPTVPDGYSFTGWEGIPATMPDKDIVVSGSLTAQNFRLFYDIPGTVIPAKDLPVDSELTEEEAPERHAMTFGGWSNLPDSMPAHDITVSGTYQPSEGVYVGISDSLVNEKGNTPVLLSEKEEIKANGPTSAVISVSGNRIEIAGRKKMGKAVITEYVRDGKVLDADGITSAATKLMSVVDGHRDEFRLIVDHKASVNTIVKVSAENTDSELKSEIEKNSEGLSNPIVSTALVSENKEEGTVDILISLLDREYGETVRDALVSAGYDVTEPVTPEYFLITALLSEDGHREGNSLVRFRTDGYMLTVLYSEGRPVFSTKNKIPYDLNDTDFETETDAEFASVTDYINQESAEGFGIDCVIMGGIYAEVKNSEEKHLRSKVKEFNKSRKSGLKKAFSKSNPDLLSLSFPKTGKRKSVAETDNNASEERWDDAE